MGALRAVARALGSGNGVEVLTTTMGFNHSRHQDETARMVPMLACWRSLGKTFRLSGVGVTQAREILVNPGTFILGQ